MAFQAPKLNPYRLFLQITTAVIYYAKQALQRKQDRLHSQVSKDRKTRVQQLRKASKHLYLVARSVLIHLTKGDTSHSVKVGSHEVTS